MEIFGMIIDLLVIFTGLFKDVATFIAAFWNFGQIIVKFISWLVGFVASFL